jgi:hypothetical protein
MRKVKYPSTQIARERFGAHSPEYRRIKALEKWAIANGYDGYAPIQRRTKTDKQQQVSMRFFDGNQG